MLLFNEQKDGILLLDEEEVREPMGVFERFFSDYRLHECRYILWAMVETCLTTDNIEFSEPGERADLLMRYKDLERLLEAGSLLYQQHQEAGKQPPSEKMRPGENQTGSFSVNDHE